MSPRSWPLARKRFMWIKRLTRTGPRATLARNPTARIQAHCEPDRVLIGHTTWVRVYQVTEDAAPGRQAGHLRALA